MRKVLALCAAVGVLVISSFTVKEYQQQKLNHKSSKSQKYVLEDQYCTLTVTNLTSKDNLTYKFSKGHIITRDGQIESGKLYNPISGAIMKILSAQTSSNKEEELINLRVEVTKDGEAQYYNLKAELSSLINGISLVTVEDEENENILRLIAKEH